MNIGIIDICWNELNINSLNEKSLGGSETWLMQISKEFSKDHKVDVYCETHEKHSVDNLTFIPFRDIYNEFNVINLSRNKYDFIILNRVVYRYNINIVALIKQFNATDNVFLQIHDLSIPIDASGDIAYNSDIDFLLLNDEIVKGVITLNEWHRDNLLIQYPNLETKVYCIPNGLDFDLFKENVITNTNRDNRILWSSCAERGLDILINDIYPIVKQHIPDFGIDIAGYNDLSDIDVQDKDIKILGNLTKDKLYEEMSKHKCWFYPGTFAETFCITMLEQITCGAIPVSPFTYGTRCTIGSEFADKYWDCQTDFYSYNSQDFLDSSHYAANKIINILQNDYVIDNELVNSIKKYTWSNSVSKYIDLYNIVNDKYEYEGIFLTMSANSDYFKLARQSVIDTWAKDLINGLYPGYTFYCYTACDEEHPVPCIDGYMIYVDCPDDLHHTYTKTKLAFQMLKDNNITYKQVYRTNTSVYINVPSIIKQIQHDKYDISNYQCGYYIKTKQNPELKFQYNIFIGVYYGMHYNLVKQIFFNGYDETMSLPLEGDDVTMTKVMMKLNIPYNLIEPNPNFQYDFPRYKCVLAEDRYKWEHFYDLSNIYQDDPYYCLRIGNVIQTRTLYNNEERITKGNEISHIYELHEAFEKIKGEF